MIRQKKQAFSLMEIMVVIIVIGVLYATVGKKIAAFWFKNEQTQTRTMMMDIKNALKEYQLHVGHYPASDKGGLKALFQDTERVGSKWQGPYMGDGSMTEDECKDAWSNDIVYNCPPQLTGKRYKRFELVSYGKEGDQTAQSGWIVEGE